MEAIHVNLTQPIKHKESHIFEIAVFERCKGFHALRIMG